jgi:hypothetical protein
MLTNGYTVVHNNCCQLVLSCSISMGRFNRKSQVTARKIQACLQEIERAILNACVCEPEEWLHHEGELLIACVQAADQVGFAHMTARQS